MYRLTKDGKSRPKMKREKIPHSPKRKEKKRKEKKKLYKCPQGAKTPKILF